MQEGEGPRALGLIVTLRSLTKPAGRSEASDGFPGLSEHADPPPWEQPGSQRAFASLVHALPALFQGLPSPPRPLPLPSPGPPGPPAGRLPLLFSLGFALLPTVVGPDPLKSSHRAFWALGSQPILLLALPTAVHGHSDPAVPRCTCLTFHPLPGAPPRLPEVSEQHTLCRDAPDAQPSPLIPGSAAPARPRELEGLPGSW